jgi:hypothetical protein
MASHRRTGVATSTVVTSPARARRRAQARRREEASWRARSGPVTVRRVDPDELRVDRSKPGT